MNRQLQLYLDDKQFFDDMFAEMDREIARSHQDMRSAMYHLSPAQALASGDNPVARRLRSMYVETEGNLHLDVSLDMSRYHREEIEVKAEGTRLWVKARREEWNTHSRVNEEFHREFKLPEGTDLNALDASLSKDGVLRITGPLPLETAEKKPSSKDKSGDS